MTFLILAIVYSCNGSFELTSNNAGYLAFAVGYELIVECGLVWAILSLRELTRKAE